VEMSDSRLERLIEAARKAAAPEPERWLDPLSELWPRAAVGAALVIGLFVAADFSLTAFAQIDLATSLSEVSEQWLFAVR
jgi:hypothetical protein